MLERDPDRYNIRRFVHVSTDEVYGDESITLCNPQIHAATKAAAEALVGAYHILLGLPVIITRGNNVYGPQHYLESVLPKVICRLMQGLPCTVHGEGEAKRFRCYFTFGKST